ncbi:MAG: helix-turn-helix domain-containing protein [Acidobacteriota bacterium]|nr:helix-turn-helix domain-containing protein [Acidobacteriota bacterium]
MTLQLKNVRVTVITNRIKAARLSAELSMRALEEISGVDAATICRCEKGKEPTLTNALKLARALNVAVEELWEIRELTGAEAANA